MLGMNGDRPWVTDEARYGFSRGILFCAELLDDARNTARRKKTLKGFGSKTGSVSFKVLTACLEAAMRQ